MGNLLSTVVAFREHDSISIGNHSAVDETIVLYGSSTVATIQQPLAQEPITGSKRAAKP